MTSATMDTTMVTAKTRVKVRSVEPRATSRRMKKTTDNLERSSART